MNILSMGLRSSSLKTTYLSCEERLVNINLGSVLYQKPIVFTGGKDKELIEEIKEGWGPRRRGVFKDFCNYSGFEFKFIETAESSQTWNFFGR